MNHADYRSAKALMDLRLTDAAQQADARDLMRLAGKAPQGWLTRKGCWLLCQLGRQMVAVGKRLEEYYPAREPSLSLGR